MTLNDFEEKVWTEARNSHGAMWMPSKMDEYALHVKAAEMYATHRYNEGIEAAVMGLGFSSKSFHYPSQYTEIAEWIRRSKLPEL
jgi:hypothetical protein